MPRRNPVQRELDLAELARRYCQGEAQTSIAASMGVVQQQISQDLKTLQQRWKQSSIRDFDGAKGEELAKIDNLERTYWDAWERSLTEKQITATKRRGAGKEGENATTEASLRREQRDGNASYLAGVHWCIERRCKILGLDAPMKVAPTDPSGEHEFNPDGARERLASSLARIAARSGAAGAPGGPDGAGSGSASS